MDAALMLQH